MPRYTYTAKVQPHKTIQGDIEAESEQEAIHKLTQMGYFPISLQSENIASFGKEGAFGLRRVSHKELVLFTGQLSTLVDSGVNIINGLSIIYNQANNKYLKAVLSDITARIKDGNSLSDSMASHPYLFSELYSSMIRTGEASGNLRDILKRLADFLEKEEEFKSSVRASLTYPFFLLLVGALTVFVLLVFVIPRLVTMFEDMGQILPLPTKILINVSAILQGYWWFILTLISVFIFLLRRFSRKPQGRASLDRLKLKLPILGEITLKTDIARLMRTLSLLLSGGVPITPSLEISVSIVENQILKSEIREFKEKISSGSSLSDSLKKSIFFPEFVTNIIAIGEETGSLEKSLMRIAEDYEKEVDGILKALMRLIEPVIILVMGLIVGFIVLSMLLPIFQINLIVR